MAERIKVMMTTEGTYPFHQGGVSSWCQTLIEKLPDVDFVMYSVIMNPYVTQKFTLPDNASLLKVPLWGIDDPGEYLPINFSEVFQTKKRTSERVIKENFLPLFEVLIREFISPVKDLKRLATVLLELNRYFSEYDYKVSFKSEAAWEKFKEIIASQENSKNALPNPNVFDLIQSLGWVYRFMAIVNAPIPDIQIGHSTAAGFCGIPCILAKLKNKVPYILTEHGVYLREQYLSLSRRQYSSYLSVFLIRMIQAVVELNYEYADVISPVCRYNTRWEEEFGVPKRKIQVIYNGVGKDLFKPTPKKNGEQGFTVVTVARVDPIKDLLTLIRAAEIVRSKREDIKFVVYGSVSVPAYYQECLELKKELGLGDGFIFAGHTDDVPSAYNSGDLVVLSSISEGFPFSVVEAMMSGKPVVATDVGGVKEALEGVGVVVKPRHHDELAEAILRILGDSETRIYLGEESRERALNLFTIDRMLGLYRDLYNNLAYGDNVLPISPAKINQKLNTEKAFALMSMGLWQQAIRFIEMAIQDEPYSPAVPFLLIELAKVYNMMGKYDDAFVAMDKANVFSELITKFKSN